MWKTAFPITLRVPVFFNPSFRVVLLLSYSENMGHGSLVTMGKCLGKRQVCGQENTAAHLLDIGICRLLLFTLIQLFVWLWFNCLTCLVTSNLDLEEKSGCSQGSKKLQCAAGVLYNCTQVRHINIQELNPWIQMDWFDF